MRGEVIERPFQRRCPTGAPGKATMQPDGQHFGLAFLPFGVKHIETVFEIALELIATREPCLNGEAHIVAIHCVGNDELIVPIKLHPVGRSSA